MITDEYTSCPKCTELQALSPSAEGEIRCDSCGILYTESKPHKILKSQPDNLSTLEKSIKQL